MPFDPFLPLAIALTEWLAALAKDDTFAAAAWAPAFIVTLIIIFLFN
jgi:hypothetical protein